MPGPAFLFGIVPLGFKQAGIFLKGMSQNIPKATAEAIDRGLLAGRTAAAKAISARYAITSAAVKDNFITKKPNWTKVEGSLIARGSMLPVTTFKVAVKKVKTGNKGPRRDVVSVTIIRKQKKPIKGAFKLPDGRIMERRQEERFPIYPVSTISVAHMSGQKDVSKLIQDAMNETYNSRLKHNVQYEIDKLKEESARVRLEAKTKLQAKEVA